MEGQELSGVLVQGLLSCTGCPLAQLNVVLTVVSLSQHVCCFKQVTAQGVVGRVPHGAPGRTDPALRQPVNAISGGRDIWKMGRRAVTVAG